MQSRAAFFAASVLFAALIAAIAWVVVEGVKAEPGLVGALVTTGVTVVSGIAVAGYQGRRQRQESAERLHRETISPFYDELIRKVGRASEQAEADGDTEAKTAEMFQEIQQQMIMWSGAGVINAWVDQMRQMEKELTPAEAMLGWGRVLRAIRAELGHHDDDLDTRTLLRIYITDIDDELPAGLK